jgi:hypothetical protein
MFEGAGKNIRPHGRPPSPRRPRGYGALGWSAAIFALSVLSAVLPLPRALGQPRSSHAANQSTSNKERRFGQPSISNLTAGKPSLLGPHVAAAMGSASLTSQLPYDARPKAPVSQLPRGFHSARDLLSRGISIPADTQLAGSQSHERPVQPSGICPPTITQSTNQSIVAGALACSDPGLGTLENHYWRAFDMNEFTGGQAYDITSVEFGIEQAESLFGTDQPLTVNLYINHGGPFPGGDWQSNLLATSGEIRVPNQEFTIFNVPITATVPAGRLELVMEVLSPDQTVEHNFFIIGANPDPETGPSYLSAPDCGNPDPLPVDCFLGPMHYVFNVNGSCAGGATPTPVPTATPTPSGTPSCPPVEITGSIDNNDPTQVDRMNRSGVSSCCGGGPVCVIMGDGQLHHYDAYPFTNTTGSAQCVTVGVNTDCQGNNFIFTAAYVGTFDPNNICANWIADEGSSPGPGNPTPFSFNIEDGQTFVLVVSEVTANEGCPSYTMTVSGLCGSGTPTPTPTPSATATATQTPTPTPTATVRPVPTPRPHPTPRIRPTPPTP